MRNKVVLGWGRIGSREINDAAKGSSSHPYCGELGKAFLGGCSDDGYEPRAGTESARARGRDPK